MGRPALPTSLAYASAAVGVPGVVVMAAWATGSLGTLGLYAPTAAYETAVAAEMPATPAGPAAAVGQAAWPSQLPADSVVAIPEPSSPAAGSVERAADGPDSHEQRVGTRAHRSTGRSDVPVHAVTRTRSDGHPTRTAVAHRTAGDPAPQQRTATGSVAVPRTPDTTTTPASAPTAGDQSSTTASSADDGDGLLPAVGGSGGRLSVLSFG